MKDKTVFAVGRAVGEVIASGEAEVGMQQIIENQPVKGAHLVGPLPPEVGNFVLYSVGFRRRYSARSPAVRALVDVPHVAGSGPHHPRQGHGAGVMIAARPMAQMSLRHRAFGPI